MIVGRLLLPPHHNAADGGLGQLPRLEIADRPQLVRLLLQLNARDTADGFEEPVLQGRRTPWRPKITGHLIGLELERVKIHLHDGHLFPSALRSLPSAYPLTRSWTRRMPNQRGTGFRSCPIHGQDWNPVLQCHSPTSIRESTDVSVAARQVLGDDVPRVLHLGRLAAAGLRLPHRAPFHADADLVGLQRVRAGVHHRDVLQHPVRGPELRRGEIPGLQPPRRRLSPSCAIGLDRHVLGPFLG